MNSLKTFMNKVGERVRDVAPQGSVSIIDGTDPRDTELEGFVCPTCFRHFSSPEVLETHYSQQHLDPSANYLCPVCKARLNSQTELEMHYTTNHGDKDYNNHSIDALREELIELSTNLREERWYTEELKKEVERLQEAFKKKENDDSEVYIHKSQLDAVEESKTLLSSEVVLLRKQLSESLEQNMVLRSEKDNLEQRASDFAVERADLRATLDSLQAEKIGLESELHEAKSSTSFMEVNKNAEIERLTSEFSRLEEIVSSRAKEILSQKEKEHALQQDLKLKSEMSAELKEEMRNLKLDFDLMKKKFQEKCDECMIFQEKLNDLSSESRDKSVIEEAVQNSSARENGEVDEDDLRETKRLLETIAELEKDKVRAEQLTMEKLKTIDDLQESLVDAQYSLNSTNSSLNLLEKSVKEKDDTIELLNNKIEQMYILKKEMEEKKEIVERLQNKNTQQEKKILDLEKNIESYTKQIEDLNSCKTDLENDLADNRVKLSETIKLLDASKLQLEDYTSNLDQNREALEAVSANEKDLRHKLELAMEDIKNLQLSKEILQSEKVTLEKELDTISSKLIKLEEQNLLNISENSELKDHVVQLEKETLVCEEKYESVSTKLANQMMHCEQIEHNFRDETENLLKRIETFEIENKELIKDKELVVEEKNSLNLKLQVKNKEEEKLRSDQTKLEATLKELQKQNSQFTKEKDDLVSKIEELERECDRERNAVVELEGRIVTQEAEMAALGGDKLELEVKVESCREEQRCLVERCVAAESEVERVQAQLVQLRRKLDDSTAALHELGRENQTLQIETVKLSERKWAEDSEVPNCSSCLKNFSMTVRRHHCRNCFQIFCNDCSSKQVSIEQTKKPVRVCDTCFAEVTSKL